MSLADAQAVATARATVAGVGFVLTANDPYFVVDIDKARDPITGAANDRMTRWAGLLAGCVVEVSMSGSGYHLWGTCDADIANTHMNRADGVEFYQPERHVALGTLIQGDINLDMTAQLRHHLKPRVIPAMNALPASRPAPEHTGNWNDQELMERALAPTPDAPAAFGAKASFDHLWNCDITALAKFYPTEGADMLDWSRADNALQSRLAF